MGFESCAQSPSTFSIMNVNENANPKLRHLEKEKHCFGDEFGATEPIKQFEFPVGINKPACKL